MKRTITAALLLVAISTAYGQTKPRQVTVKKATYVDSTYYLPDTLAVVFKELIVQKDTIYEKWQHGYVIWQTWQERKNTDRYGIGVSGSFSTTSNLVLYNQIEWKFPYTEVMQGGFMYSDRKTRVKNKVLLALKP